VRVVTHEQTLSPGLANRIIAVFANKILISWTQTAKFFPKNKTNCATDGAIIQFASAKTAQRAGLTIEPAISADAAPAVEAPAEVIFDETRTTAITSTVPTLVIRWLVSPGQPVKKGEVIAEVESPEMANLKADYLENMANFRIRERERKRNEELRQQDIVSVAEFEASLAAGIARSQQAESEVEERLRALEAETAPAESSLAAAEEERSALERRESRLRAEVQAARSRADLAAKALARKRELAADKLIPERELREAEAASASASSDAQVALAAVKAFGSIGDRAGDPSRFTLRSPVEGEVIERSVAMGQLADPARTLLRIGDLSHLWLIAHVFERDAVRVKTSGRAAVSFAALPGRTVEGTIKLIGREVDQSSRTIPVRLDVPNVDGTLRPGMSANVALPLGDDTGTVVTVPIAAVQRVGEGWAVFIPGAEEGAFEIRKIGRGRELGGDVEVLSGLTAKETVVVDGAFLLKAEADKARGEGGDDDHH